MSTEQQRIGAPRRYLSRLTRGTLAVIMSGGRGERLKQLTEDRCKPAAPFGGKFRIIDFVLSNCLNSGIRQISVLTLAGSQRRTRFSACTRAVYDSLSYAPGSMASTAARASK